MVGVIATHNGKFHCDEALACFILKRLNQFRDYTLLRTRILLYLPSAMLSLTGRCIRSFEETIRPSPIKFNETMQTLGILDFNTRLSSANRAVFKEFNETMQTLGILDFIITLDSVQLIDLRPLWKATDCRGKHCRQG
ncbi:unnamed protein product [Cylicocyclus nassatus]|uniref:Uncharacterized protein n=1 Tax=Cylicocyclus nassatus TaxID=53992 RepID=A0AA36M5W9_CYLNA|nr:unnamed protein product [Cylicocyclus nassatus]